MEVDAESINSLLPLKIKNPVRGVFYLLKTFFPDIVFPIERVVQW